MYVCSRRKSRYRTNNNNEGSNRNGTRKKNYICSFAHLYIHSPNTCFSSTYCWYVWLPKSNADKIFDNIHYIFRGPWKKSELPEPVHQWIVSEDTHHSHLMPPPMPSFGVEITNSFRWDKTSVLSTVPTESTACHDFIIFSALFFSRLDVVFIAFWAPFSPSLSFFSLALQHVCVCVCVPEPFPFEKQFFVKLNSLKSLSVCYFSILFLRIWSLAII